MALISRSGFLMQILFIACVSMFCHAGDEFLVWPDDIDKHKGSFEKAINQRLSWSNCTDSSLKVALRWNEIVHSAPMNEKIDRKYIFRFIGFLESEFSVEAPDWWITELARMRKYGDGSVSKHLTKTEKSRWTKVDSRKLSGLSEFQLQNDSLKVKCNKSHHQVIIDLIVVKQMIAPDDDVELIDEYLEECIAGSCKDEVLCFAFHGTSDATSAPFTLHAVDIKSGTNIWNANIISGKKRGLDSGVYFAKSFSDIVFTDSHVWIFGTHNEGPYANGFKLENGKLDFVFSTKIFQKKAEHHKQ